MPFLEFIFGLHHNPGKKVEPLCHIHVAARSGPAGSRPRASRLFSLTPRAPVCRVERGPGRPGQWVFPASLSPPGGSEGALEGTAGFCCLWHLGLAPRAGRPRPGLCSRVSVSLPFRATHLHLSLWFSQKLKACLLKCRLTCFFYKFSGITIDFWLRISKSYL